MLQRIHYKPLEIVFDIDEDYNELVQQNNEISLFTLELYGLILFNLFLDIEHLASKTVLYLNYLTLNFHTMASIPSYL